MAINYGSNEVRSTGKIIGGDGQPSGRTLYFSGGDWSTLSNWFIDAAKTIQSSSLPSSNDTAIISGTITSAAGTISADTIIMDGGDLSFTYNINDVKNIIFKNNTSLNNSGTIGSINKKCNIYLYDSSSIYNTGSLTINGNLFLNDTSTINSNSSNINVYGDVKLNCSGTGQPIYSSNELNVRGGNFYAYGPENSSQTIRYLTVYGGNCEISKNISLQYSTIRGNFLATYYCSMSNSTFYGDVHLYDNSGLDNTNNCYGNVYINDYSNIQSGNNFYGNTVEIVGYSFINGSGIYFNNQCNIILKESGYISSSTTITLNDSSKLILDGDNNSGGNSSVSGSSDSVVEVYRSFGVNGLGAGSSINCGTLKFFGSASSSNSLTLGSNIKKIQFFDTSYIGYSSLSTPNDSVIEFYDKSYIGNATLYLGSNSIAKLYDNSYMGTSSQCSGGEVYFYDNSYWDGGTPNSVLYYNGVYSESGSSGTVINSNENNYQIPDVKIIKLTPYNNIDITGLVQNYRNQREITIINTSGIYNLTLKHNSGLSNSGNKIYTPDSDDFVLGPDQTVNLIYDSAGYWRIISDNKIPQILQAPYRTLYFSGGDWASASNWYLDSALTLPAGSIPTSEDTAILENSVNISSCNSGNITANYLYLKNSTYINISSHTFYVKNLIAKDSSYLATSSCSFFSVQGNTCNITLYDGAYFSNAGNINIYGDLTLKDSSYLDNSSYINNLFGDLIVDVISGTSTGFLNTNNYSYIRGDAKIVGTSNSNTVLKKCYIYGSCETNNARFDGCYFYGNVIGNNDSYFTGCYFDGTTTTLNDSEIYGSSLYYTDLSANYGSSLTSSTCYGGTINLISGTFNGSTTYGSMVNVTQGYMSNSNYFYTHSIINLNTTNIGSSAIYLSDTCELNITSVTANSANFYNNDTNYWTKIRIYDSSNLQYTNVNCGTLEFYGTSSIGSSMSGYISTVKIIRFFDTSYIGGGSFSAPSDCILEFYDRSYMGVNTTLGSNGIAKFFDYSYTPNITLSGGSLVEFHSSSTNGGTISTPKAIFYDNSNQNGSIDTSSVSLFYRNFPTALTPAAISTNTNNYDPGYGDVLRLEAASANQDITGLVLRDRYLVVIINIGSTYNITLKHQDSNSTDANRFITLTGGDHVILPDGSTKLLYDSTSSRWRVL